VTAQEKESGTRNQQKGSLSRRNGSTTSTRKKRSNSSPKAWEETKTTEKTHLLERFVTGLLFTQMSAKKGIEKYGEEAELKLIAEFTQLLEYSVFHGKTLSS